MAIRGSVKIIRSDRGTNFVGTINELKLNSINVEDSAMNKCLDGQGTTWIFNPHHSSHMGGVWERMIATIRRIFESMMLGYGVRNLTHEVLFCGSFIHNQLSTGITNVRNPPNTPKKTKQKYTPAGIGKSGVYEKT